jgi:hypothetical protein
VPPAGIDELAKPAWPLGLGDSSAVGWMHSWILSPFGKRFGFPYEDFCTLICCMWFNFVFSIFDFYTLI